jgi:hypothetical protein
MKTIEERLDALEERNLHVDANKAWETSFERRIAVFVLTYIVIGIFLTIIDAPYPWVSAFVPGIGFALSTLTITWLKRKWIASRNSK